VREVLVGGQGRLDADDLTETSGVSKYSLAKPLSAVSRAAASSSAALSSTKVSRASTEVCASTSM